MGPFVLVPFMECRHSVFSMYHSVNGKLLLNGKKYKFDDAVGGRDTDAWNTF